MVRGPFQLIHQPESRNRSPSTEGTLAGPFPNTQKAPEKRGSTMYSKELLGPDLLSEIVLLGFGMLMLASLMLLFATALARP